MTSHGPGMIALSSGDCARYAACRDSIEGLQRPPSTIRYTSHGLSVAENWNKAAAVFLSTSTPTLEWMFLVNDDHIYPPDTLLRLLDRNVEVVTGLYTFRSLPFRPILFDRLHEDGRHVLGLELPNTRLDSASALIPIVACGDGAMLVRRSVFERVEPPWWSYGLIDSDRSDHDLIFCERLRNAGITIHADLSVPIGHVTPLMLMPLQRPDGAWIVQIADKHMNGVELLVVAPDPLAAEVLHS